MGRGGPQEAVRGAGRQVASGGQPAHIHCLSDQEDASHGHSTHRQHRPTCNREPPPVPASAAPSSSRSASTHDASSCHRSAPRRLRVSRHRSAWSSRAASAASGPCIASNALHTQPNKVSTIQVRTGAQSHKLCLPCRWSRRRTCGGETKFRPATTRIWFGLAITNT